MDDALAHFLTSNDDPYTLLSTPDLPLGPQSTEKDIRAAWKKTALKFHPDKQQKNSGVDEAAANRLYILRQDAYGVLSEPHLREQYDHALRAKEQKRERDAAFEGRRRAMKEDLERREKGVGSVGGVKRKMEGAEEMEREEAELRRLKEDGQRRRRERAEMLRREAEEEEKRDREAMEGVVEDDKATPPTTQEIDEIDRSIRLRFPQNDQTKHLDQDRFWELFSRFGVIEAIPTREKRIKVDGQKHRQPFTTVVIVFSSIVAAHAAVTDYSTISNREQGDWLLFGEPTWASGHEPDCIPKPRSASPAPAVLPATPGTPAATNGTLPKAPNVPNPSAPSTPTTNGLGNGLKKVPSFGSFKGGTPKFGGVGSISSPKLDDITMIRLKNAEKRRLEEKIRREDEAAAAAAAVTAAAADGAEV